MSFITNSGDLVALSHGYNVQVVIQSTGTTVLKYTHASTLPVKKSSGGAVVDHDIVCHAFSRDGRRFAAVTGDKKLLLWDVSCWQQLPCRSVQRRPTCIAFCNTTSDILVIGDKTGDVYKYDLCMTLEEDSDTEESQSLILGHLSMVLDVQLSVDDKYVLTADRDEKIRVSEFPHSYIIHSYCLGHTKLVSSIQILSDHRVISAGGDCTIRTWDFLEGRQLSVFKLSSVTTDCLDSAVISQVVHQNKCVCFIVERRTYLYFLQVSEEAVLSSPFTIEVDFVPRRVSFTESGRLLVSTFDKDRPIRIFERNSNTETFEETGGMPLLGAFSSSSLIIENGSSEDAASYYKELLKGTKRSASDEITPESSIHGTGFISACKTARKNGNCDSIEENVNPD